MFTENPDKKLIGYEFVGAEHRKTRSDLTVNLYNYIHGIRKDVLVDLWPVQARGLH